jgi:UDP-N-acetylmuramyl pentapeptide phosphotransferase/UDP-N-acetylglucosamine-1-phosphate transferase
VAELLVSFAVAMAAAPFVLRVLLRHGVLDIPNARSSHVTPVPRGGGIACLAGVLAGLILASALNHDVPWLAVAGAVLLAVVGFADDQGTLAAAPRLGAQMAVGALVGASVGGGWWILAGMICIPVAVNVVNFMDGINGITSLNMAAWGCVAMAVGYAHGVPSLVVIGAVTAGSTIAFLPWNAPVARLFLGDVGSYLLGALVGIGIIIGAHQTPSVVVLLAPLSIYLADTATVLLRRTLHGEPLMIAHRQHVYQRLVSEAGMSHSAVAAFTVILALVVTLSWVPGSTLIGSPLTLLVLAIYLGSPTALRKNRRGVARMRYRRDRSSEADTHVLQKASGITQCDDLK